MLDPSRARRLRHGSTAVARRSKDQRCAYRPHTSATYHRGAVEHARTIRYYAQNHPTVAQETAKLHAAEVRKNLTGAKQEIRS